MKRRDFITGAGGSSLLLGSTSRGLEPLLGDPSETQIMLPTLPSPAPLSEVVLFGFDDRAFPFQNHVQTHLAMREKPKLVLRPGPKGSHDEVVHYYGSIIRIGETFHMWYQGNHGPATDINRERENYFLCYATSKDGVNWEKPDLGIVEFNGSRRNNICVFPFPPTAGAVLYDPNDPDPNRRFKIAFESTEVSFSQAFSPDGLHWKSSLVKPAKVFFEMSGVTKFRGLYYVYGQSDQTGHHPLSARRVAAYVSDDFEHWSACAACGFDRAPNLIGPSTDDVGVAGNQWEQTHLGAGVWNRGNVLTGIYGQWHGSYSGDRWWVEIDLGLIVSHDALHFYEPIPGFRLIPAREQPQGTRGVAPAIVQGQGFENSGDKTYFWYGQWRGTEGSGVRLVTWERDRLGMLNPFLPEKAQAISCPIQVLKGPAKVFVNASGLGQHCRLRVGLLTEGFRPIPGYSDDDGAILAEDSLRMPVRWRAGDTLPGSSRPIRLDIRFEGIRPEDGALHAAYIAGA